MEFTSVDITYPYFKHLDSAETRENIFRKLLGLDLKLTNHIVILSSIHTSCIYKFM